MDQADAEEAPGAVEAQRANHDSCVTARSNIACACLVSVSRRAVPIPETIRSRAEAYRAACIALNGYRHEA